MQFSNDFFIELEERLPEYLLDFWGMRNFYHFAENMQYKDFIRESVTSYFDDIDEQKLSDAISKLRASQRKKKHDWVKKYYNSIESDYKDPYNPLSVEYFRLQSMQPQELVRQYKDMDMDDIMVAKREETTNQVEAWKNDKTSLFTQFPVMHLHSAKIKQKALKEDILTATADYISKELKYDFSANVKMLPTDIAYRPFFALSASKLDLEEINGIVQNVVKNGTDGSTFSVVPTGNDNHNMMNLDKKDYSVYQEIVHLAANTGMNDNGKLLVKINCSTIAKKIYNYAINVKEANQVKNSIYKLANRRFIYKKGNTRVEYVLVDSIISDDEGSSDMALLLGDVISSAILQKDIIGISKKMENKLSSPHAYAFIYALQGIRFQLQRDTPDNMVKQLQLDFFENCVRFTTRSFKKKVAIVFECLDDYMAHDAVIKNYNYSNDMFNIEFLPIDDDDKQYYNDWLKSHPY